MITVDAILSLVYFIMQMRCDAARHTAAGPNYLKEEISDSCLLKCRGWGWGVDWEGAGSVLQPLVKRLLMLRQQNN